MILRYPHISAALSGLLLFALVSNARSELNNSPKVKTQYGTVRGIRSAPFPANSAAPGRTADVFLSIPYAEPPVGELRFERPIPLKSNWTVERAATSFGPGCVPLIEFPGIPVAEDCLTLNIFRPSKRKSSKKLPVLVYIHGGGYAFGNALIYGYQELSNSFVSRGLVVVTIQYRLGFFGFASTGDSTLPGNLGLWDNLAALKWLHENIGEFGGDPNQLTIWGLSSGAGSASLLTLSPLARPYIHGSIEMSGSAVAAWAVGSETAKYTRDFAEFIKCPNVDNPTAIRRCFEEQSAQFIMKKTAEFTSPTAKLLSFTPTIDGEFLPTDLNTLLNSAKPLPVMAGVSEMESHYFVVLGKDPPINPVVVHPSNFTRFGREDLETYIRDKLAVLFDVDEEKKQIAVQQIVDFYSRDAEYNEADELFFFRRYNELTSDYFFNIPTLQQLKQRVHLGWPGYFYITTYFNEAQFAADTPLKAATHANEYPYMNGLFPVGEFEFDDEDHLFRNTLSALISNFTKTGRPDPRWHPLSQKMEGFARLEAKMEYLDEPPYPKSTRMWSELSAELGYDFIERRPLAKNNLKTEL